MYEPLIASPTSEHERLLNEHDWRSQSRHEKEMKKLHKLKKHIKSEEKDDEMGGAREDLNFVGVPNMGFGGFGGYPYAGDGLGGGLGLIALLALLGRRDGFAGFGGGVSGLNNLQGAIDTNAILAGIGDIKAAVPLAESQMQLALAGVQNDVNNQLSQQTIALQQQGFQSQLANCQSFANLGDKVDALSTAQALGFGDVGMQIAQNGWAVTQAVQNDGEKTRALIGQIDRENLNRIITTQAGELAELRNESCRERDRHGIEINMINNQNQNQLQFQQQQQVLAGMTHLLADTAQVARATNQNLIVGNTGATTTGAQSANPVNVRA